MTMPFIIDVTQISLGDLIDPNRQIDLYRDFKSTFLIRIWSQILTPHDKIDKNGFKLNQKVWNWLKETENVFFLIKKRSKTSKSIDFFD